ncbi:hypothetical protein [Streptomyces noursei]|uniref:hypothetical protein n=1 Tax=Streptomyces noursei TaxID=1971 RepID=UPI0023B79677|nr:hypothetical protein [Streptomyces noursei]
MRGTPARAVTLLLLGALCWTAPAAVARAAPAHRPVRATVVERDGGGDGHRGQRSAGLDAVALGRGGRGRSGSGWHSHTTRHSSTSGTSRSRGRMPWWEALLVFVVFVGFFGYLGYRGVQKLRRRFG